MEKKHPLGENNTARLLFKFSFWENQRLEEEKLENHMPSTFLHIQW